MDLWTWWNDRSSGAFCRGGKSPYSSHQITKYTGSLARIISDDGCQVKMLIDHFVLRKFEFNKSSHVETLKKYIDVSSTLWWQLEPRKQKVNCMHNQERGYSYEFRLHLRCRKQTSDKRYSRREEKTRKGRGVLNNGSWRMQMSYILWLTRPAFPHDNLFQGSRQGKCEAERWTLRTHIYGYETRILFGDVGNYLPPVVPRPIADLNES